MSPRNLSLLLSFILSAIRNQSRTCRRAFFELFEIVQYLSVSHSLTLLLSLLASSNLPLRVLFKVLDEGEVHVIRQETTLEENTVSPMASSNPASLRATKKQQRSVGNNKPTNSKSTAQSRSSPQPFEHPLRRQISRTQPLPLPSSRTTPETDPPDPNPATTPPPTPPCPPPH